MKVTLQQAEISDAEVLHKMQIAAFAPLLEKYRDYETSPATEPVEKTASRLKDPDSFYFRILVDGELAGAIHIVRKGKNGSLWISPLYIAPAFQGKGLAQQAMKLAELKFPADKVWELSTLAEETGHCYLYEKLGYERTERIEPINERTTLVYYKKEMEA